MPRSNALNGKITGTGGTVTSLNLGASFTSDPIFVGNIDIASIQFTVASTSTAVGTLVVQTSDDDGSTETSAASSASLPNWTDVVGSTANINATTGSPFRIDMQTVSARWARLSYTFTSGAGTATARITGKGPS